MKSLRIILALLIGVATCRATMITYDPTLHVQTAVDQVQNFLQYTETQISTLNTYLTQAKSLLYQGNPANLISQIPGVSTVQGLAGQVGQLANSVNEIRGMINPSSYEGQFNGILSGYSLPSWNGWTSGYGVNIQPQAGDYQFATTQYTAAQKCQELISGIEAQKASLQAQIAEVTNAMNSATTQSEVEKYHAALTSLHASMDQLNGMESSLQQRYQLLMSQVTAARTVYMQSQAERASAMWQSSSENALAGNRPVTGISATDYGYNGDTSYDKSSANGIGNHNNTLTPYTGSGGVSSAAVAPDVAAAQGLSVGQQFSMTTDSGKTYNLTYDDTSGTPGTIDIYAKSAAALGGNAYKEKIISISKPNVN